MGWAWKGRADQAPKQKKTPNKSEEAALVGENGTGKT